MYERGIFPVLHDRNEKFPEGESLNDVGRRAQKAIDELLMPHLWEAAKEGRSGDNLAVVSHGLCISELVAALVKMDSNGTDLGGMGYRGLMNTAWARVTIGILVRVSSDIINAMLDEATDRARKKENRSKCRLQIHLPLKFVSPSSTATNT
jgi:hypothetical protein